MTNTVRLRRTVELLDVEPLRRNVAGEVVS
ncbi:hypothetical protein ACVLV4_001887 [Rathayibacter agropyri]